VYIVSLYCRALSFIRTETLMFCTINRLIDMTFCVCFFAQCGGGRSAPSRWPRLFGGARRRGRRQLIAIKKGRNRACTGVRACVRTIILEKLNVRQYSTVSTRCCCCCRPCLCDRIIALSCIVDAVAVVLVAFRVDVCG